MQHLETSLDATVKHIQCNATYLNAMEHLQMQCNIFRCSATHFNATRALMHMGPRGAAVWCTDRSSPGTHWAAYPPFFPARNIRIVVRYTYKYKYKYKHKHNINLIQLFVRFCDPPYLPSPYVYHQILASDHFPKI